MPLADAAGLLVLVCSAVVLAADAWRERAPRAGWAATACVALALNYAPGMVATLPVLASLAALLEPLVLPLALGCLLLALPGRSLLGLRARRVVDSLVVLALAAALLWPLMRTAGGGGVWALALLVALQVAPTWRNRDPVAAGMVLVLAALALALALQAPWAAVLTPTLALLLVTLAQRERLRTASQSAAAAAHDLARSQATLVRAEDVARLRRQAGADLSKGLVALGETLRAQPVAAPGLLGRLEALSHVAQLEPRVKRVDLKALCERITAHLLNDTPTVEKPLLKLTSAVVQADPLLLRHVLQELIANALKFSAERVERRLDVSVVSGDDGVMVCVSDNGVGFDNALAKRLFTPFERLHGAAFPGTGLGLVIARHAAERLGGRIWAESAPGAGARFYFTIGAH